VATIAAPASHQGTWRPAMKYSLRLSPPRFVKMKPIAVESAKYAATISQSTAARLAPVAHQSAPGGGEGGAGGGAPSAASTESASATRTRPILVFMRVGFTRLESRITYTPRPGSTQNEVR
jgi:hypothetical protein